MLKKGMIIRLNSEPAERNWLILEVKETDIRKGLIDAERAGLYGFGGLWYGRNAMKHKNYGKIKNLDNLDDIVIIKKTIQNLSVDEIMKLVN